MGVIDLLRAFIHRHRSILTVLNDIQERLDHMSVTAAQAQQNLDALTAVATTAIPQTIALLNQLAAANAAGTQLDPVAVQADIDAISAQFAALSTAVTNDTPAPAAPVAPTP